MLSTLRNWRVITAALCGVAISTSFYLFRVDTAFDHAVSPLMWPIVFVLFSLSIPPLFVASFISDVMRGPELLGLIVAFFYWPMMGAFIALRKHYLIWILGIGLVHFAVGGVFLYLLSNADFIFL